MANLLLASFRLGLCAVDGTSIRSTGEVGRRERHAQVARRLQEDGPMVVLVVEDDPDGRAMMDQMLHLEGFAPVIAANGEEALLLLRSGLPAKAILLDLMMPKMDGWAFRRAQRNDPAISHIPVIIISAVADVRQDELAASAVFSKPLDFDALVGELRRLCLNSPGSNQ